MSNNEYCSKSNKITKFSKSIVETCPVRCKTCGSGGSPDGGLPNNSNGICEDFCSIYGACGNGDAYRTGDDCRGCTVSGNFQVMNIDQVFYEHNISIPVSTLIK